MILGVIVTLQESICTTTSDDSFSSNDQSISSTLRIVTFNSHCLRVMLGHVLCLLDYMLPTTYTFLTSFTVSLVLAQTTNIDDTTATAPA